MAKISLQIIIGVLFLFSAYSKLISPGIFEILLIDNGIFDHRETAAFFTRLLIGSELALGLLVLQPNFLKKVIIPVIIGLLVIFTIHLSYAGFILGDTENCGCFGELIQMSPVESILKNLISIGLAIGLFRLIKTDKKSWALPLVIAIASFAFVFTVAPIKNIKDFKFSKYRYFEGKGRIDLNKGDKLLAVFNLDCEHCQETAATIAELQKDGVMLPETYALFYEEGQFTVDDFNAITQSNFPYIKIDVNAFFDLIGAAPPRIYWLQNGEVREIWDENFRKNLETNFRNLGH